MFGTRRLVVAVGPCVTLAIAALFACSSETFTEAHIDAGPDDGAVADAAIVTTKDAASDAAPGTLPCGKTACNAPAEACCVARKPDEVLGELFQRAAAEGKCVPYASCVAPSVAIRCTSPSFCDGVDASTKPVCCVTHMKDTFTSASCMPQGACDITQPNDILCEPLERSRCPASHPRCAPLTGDVSFAPFAICQ